MKYLEGEAKPGGHLRISLGMLDYDPTKKERTKALVIVAVGYDRGPGGRGYEFHFEKATGFLRRMTIVPSE